MASERDSLSKEDDFSPRQAFGFALIILFLVGFIVPLAASGAFLDWVKFLKDFQTLISGVAAVLAAYVTVQFMMATDRESGKRQAETVQRA